MKIFKCKKLIYLKIFSEVRKTRYCCIEKMVGHFFYFPTSPKKIFFIEIHVYNYDTHYTTQLILTFIFMSQFHIFYIFVCHVYNWRAIFFNLLYYYYYLYKPLFSPLIIYPTCSYRSV